MTEIQKKKTGIALASFICGLFFIIPLLGTLLGVIALILGIVALAKKDQGGNWMAISGIVMGGFSVLMIPIIGLFAAIAIPNFLRARLSANEAAAMQNLKAVGESCQMYYANNQMYPANPGELTSGDTPYLDTTIFQSEGMYGYTYTYQYNGKNGFIATAVPIAEGTTGNNYYVINQTNALFLDGDEDGVPGSSGDTIIQQKS